MVERIISPGYSRALNDSLPNIRDDVLFLLDSIRQQKSSWRTAEQWHDAYTRLNTTLTDFEDAVSITKHELDNEVRNYQFQRSKMLAEAQRLLTQGKLRHEQSFSPG